MVGVFLSSLVLASLARFFLDNLKSRFLLYINIFVSSVNDFVSSSLNHTNLSLAGRFRRNGLINPLTCRAKQSTQSDAVILMIKVYALRNCMADY